MTDRADGILAVAVSPPRFVAPLGWTVVACGALAFFFSILWLGFSVLGAGLLFLVHHRVGIRSRYAPGAGVLLVEPGGAWRWSDGREVFLVHAWRHIFGLTLAFNCAPRPHNPSERLTLTIWRCNVPAPVYRRLSVAVAWQRMQPRRIFITEPV